jgi:hypothetical protein
MDKPIPAWLEARIKRPDPTEVEFVPSVAQCDDCGETVENRTVRHSICRDDTKIPHIKSQCSHCKLYRNPETGVYDSGFQDINAYFRKKKSKKNK